MKIYSVSYSLMGSGYIEILASSKREAEEIMFNLSDDKLISNANFHKSLEIESIEITN
jgi:hypothetical protein